MRRGERACKHSDRSEPSPRAGSPRPRATLAGREDAQACSEREAEGGSIFFDKQRCGGANRDYSSRRIFSPRFPHGRRMRVALFLCMGKACCKFCSALALATRKTVEARKDVRVPCRHERQHQTLHPERARSHQPYAQRQAWAVNSHSQCRTSGRVSRRATSRKGLDSYPVPRVGPTQAQAIHQARLRCRCRCAPPSYLYKRPARCPPLSRDNTRHSGSADHLQDNSGRRPQV